MEVEQEWLDAGWDPEVWDIYDAELVIETALDYMDEEGYF